MARPPLFLARRGYRLRRVMDAARLLPVFGLFLLLLPLFWGAGGSGDGAAGGSTARDGVYLFLVWPLLILIAGLLSHALAPVAEAPEEALPPPVEAFGPRASPGPTVADGPGPREGQGPRKGRAP